MYFRLPMDKKIIQNNEQIKPLKSLKERKAYELASPQLGTLAKTECSKIFFVFCKRIGVNR